ncbi:MAG: methyltransferase domain-containing protein [Magnetococcales bacterium]|nr:methyltransferase domain-containing protein [Magnetococcales bacterium]
MWHMIKKGVNGLMAQPLGAFGIMTKDASYWLSRAWQLKKRGAWKEAEQACRKALALDETLPEAWRDLAGIMRGMHRNGEAVDCYERFLALKPDSAWGWFQLGTMQKKQGNQDAARHAWQTYLDYDPQDRRGAGLQLHDLSESGQGWGSSTAYLQRTYSALAEGYDRGVTKEHYHGHRMILDKVAELMPDSTIECVLDLGCGTGMLGQGLKARFPFLKLDGVDISADMLAEADKKNKYDRLECGDMARWLEQAGGYDLIIAGASLIHLSDLVPTLTAANRALNPGGQLVFTLFSNDRPGVRMKRQVFLHHPDVVRDAVSAAGLVLHSMEERLHERHSTYFYMALLIHLQQK